MEKTQGIYRIQQISTSLTYIGSSVDIGTRWRHHLSTLKAGKHPNQHLQRAWTKYGASDFTFHIIEVVIDISVLYEREQYHMDMEKPAFNMAVSSTNPMLGRKHSSETLAKMSTAQKGRAVPEEQRARISASLRGRKGRELTEDARKQISESLKGHSVSIETIEKRKQTIRERGGYSHNEEVRRQIGEASAKRERTDETKRRTSESIKKWWADRKAKSEENEA